MTGVQTCALPICRIARNAGFKSPEAITAAATRAEFRLQLSRETRDPARAEHFQSRIDLLTQQIVQAEERWTATHGGATATTVEPPTNPNTARATGSQVHAPTAQNPTGTR